MMVTPRLQDKLQALGYGTGKLKAMRDSGLFISEGNGMNLRHDQYYMGKDESKAWSACLAHCSSKSGMRETMAAKVRLILLSGYDLHVQQDGEAFTAWTREAQDCSSCPSPEAAVHALWPAVT